MTHFQIHSSSPPFNSPEVRGRFVDVLVLAGAMGLLDGVNLEVLDSDLFSQVVERLSEVGIGGDVRAATVSGTKLGKEAEYSAALGRLYRALQESPVPESEWESLSELFELDQLAELLGISQASVRRYSSGERRTPDDTVERLHLLTALVGDLAGAYNDYGVRRWFQRVRTPLGGRTPGQVLKDGRAGEVAEVRKLARAARSGGAW